MIFIYPIVMIFGGSALLTLGVLNQPVMLLVVTGAILIGLGGFCLGMALWVTAADGRPESDMRPPRILQTVILFLSFFIATMAINNNGTMSKAFATHITETQLVKEEEDHAQLAFCFGGYAYLYNLAVKDNNKKLSIKIYQILENLTNNMAAIEYIIAEDGRFDSVWGDMFEIAINAQIKGGMRYVNQVGPFEFIADIKRCEAILRS